MAVLLLPFLALCGLSEEIFSMDQVACGDRVREAQSICACVMRDLLYARSRFSILRFYDTGIAGATLVGKRLRKLDGVVVRTPVGSVSGFVPGMAIVCGTGPPIHLLQLGLNQRNEAVPWRHL